MTWEFASNLKRLVCQSVGVGRSDPLTSNQGEPNKLNEPKQLNEPK